MKKIRIGIVGIGGTGGFFGGKLAKHYKGYDSVEIVFIARNETRKKILSDGLNVVSVEGDFSIHPDLVTDDANEIGILDILLVCVKSYGLEKAINQYKGNLKKGSVVITIQNLVNQAERVEKLLPAGVDLLEGCAYIISNIVEPGHIWHKGGPATLIFGKDEDVTRFQWIHQIMLDAGIKATLSDQVAVIIWKKFLFISPVAVASSHFSCTIGELRSDPEKLNFLEGLMNELFELITIKKIGLDLKEVSNHLEFLNSLPANGKPSMQLDIESGKPSEIDSLLDYVVEEAKKFDLHLANYSTAQQHLKKVT